MTTQNIAPFFILQKVFAASNPTARVGWVFDEIGTEGSSQRHMVKTSTGVLHVFLQAKGSSNTCGGTTGSGLLWFMSTDSGATWSCQAEVSSDTLYEHPSVLVDSSDNLYLIYSGWHVSYRKFTKGSGNSWTMESEQRIITASGSTFGARGVATFQGTTRIWFALMYSDAGSRRVRVYYSDGLGTAPTWTQSADLDTADSNSNIHFPTIVRYGSNIGVIYNAYDSGTDTRSIQWRHRSDSDALTTWSTAETITTTTGHSYLHAAVVDDSDQIHLVYGAAGTSSNTQVTYRYYNGSSWSAAVTITDSNHAGGHSPTITTDGTNVWVFYQGRHKSGIGNSTAIGRVAYRKGVSPFASANFESEVVLNSSDRAYDKVYTYISGTYTDKTSEAAGTGTLTIVTNVSDALYVGQTEKFRSVTGKIDTAGAGGVVAYEYWNGSSWTTLSTFSTQTPNFTSASVGQYEVNFSPPSDWTTKEIDSTNAPGTYYYIRARVTTQYTTTPIADELWAYPQTGAIQVPSRVSSLLPIVWYETSPFTDGDALVQFSSVSINTNPSTPSSLGGHVSGSYTSDTTPTLTFTLSDSDSADTIKYRIQVDDSSDFSSLIVDYTSALSAQGSSSFTVGQAAGSGSYTTGSSGQTLSDGSYYWRVKAIDDDSAESSYSTANSGSVAFIVDGTSPSTPGTPSTNSPTTDTTPTWTWTASSDTGSGLASTPYTLQWSQSSSFSSDVSSSTETSSSFTHSTALTDGTWYFRVKASDTAGNDSSYSANGSVVIDTVGPSSVDLQAPGNNAYINTDRPIFRFTASSTGDATSGLAKYKLIVDNGDSGNFTIDDIPVSRTEMLETTRYVIFYENFSDSDTTNNTIALHTKSSSDWGSDQNDGKLKEGRRYWRVVSVDSTGNETSNSRTVFVDKSTPQTLITQFNEVPYTTGFKTTDTTPTIFGNITDSLAGDKTENAIAAGPESINLTIEKANILGVYTPYSIVTIKLTEHYFSDTGQKVTDTSQNTAAKYSSFSYSVSEPLPFGTYQLTLTGNDKAGNVGSSQGFSLQIGAGSSVLTPEENRIVEREIKKIVPQVTKNQQEEIKKSLEITKSSEAQSEKTNALSSLQELVTGIVTGIGTSVGNLAYFRQEATLFGTDVIIESTQKPMQFISRVGDWAAYSIASFDEIVLQNEPTKITDVKVAYMTETTALITWKTNHYATSKVNYGTTLDFGKTIQSDNKVREHRVVLTGLTSETTYVYEVMSQNKNYVYDAHHTFTTLKKNTQ